MTQDVAQSAGRLGVQQPSLAQLRGYEDAENGIREEFLEATLGSQGSWGILSAPLDGRLLGGWVVCPSLGVEEAHLRRLESLASRRLAAAGFAVLRIRPRVDSLTGPIAEIDVRPRLEEVRDAIEQLLERGAERVGAAGALFGATVAAVVAERERLAAIALWEPIVRGKRFLRDALKRHAVAELVGDDGAVEAPPGELPTEQLARQGWTVIRGLRLRQEAYDAIARIDLLEDLRTFTGPSFVAGISPSGERGPAVGKLAEHLASLGGDVRVEDLRDPLPVPFGEMYFTGVGPTRTDSRLDVDRLIADLTVEWAADAFSSTKSGSAS